MAEEALAVEEVVTTTVATEEDLPTEIVSTTRSWLYRYSKSPSPEEKKEERFDCTDFLNLLVSVVHF